MGSINPRRNWKLEIGMLRQLMIVGRSRCLSCMSGGGGGGGGGSVMSFGDGSHGALGLQEGRGMESDAFEPTRVQGLPPKQVTSIGAGHYHSLAVTAHGHLWAWGRNHEFQLGRGPPSSSSSHNDSWDEPKKVQGLDGVRVVSAFASGVVSAAVGDDGSLWVWGKSKRGQLGLGKGVTEAVLPSKVDALAGEHIVKVSFGWGHALACTKDGKLFGWGYSADGRLDKIGVVASEAPMSPSLEPVGSTGREHSNSLHEVAEERVLEQMENEKDMPIIWEPCLLQESLGVPVVDVACGLDHSLVLCSNGTLLSSGSNIYSQLGRSNGELGILPVEMHFQPLSISAGLGHSLAVCQILTPEGRHNCGVVTWGWNRNAQLGRVGPENTPLMVEGLEVETPVSVSGGRVHSMALTSKQHLFVWGCGKNGRLGLGSSADEAEPTLLEYLEEFEVIQAVSGYDHNLVLVVE